MSQDSDSSQDSPERVFVREFLKPYLGNSQDIKFFLIKDGERYYASVARGISKDFLGLVALNIRPISEKNYSQISKLYGDSIARMDSGLEISNRYQVYANLLGKVLGPLTKEQREYISRTDFK